MACRHHGGRTGLGGTFGAAGTCGSSVLEAAGQLVSNVLSHTLFGLFFTNVGCSTHVTVSRPWARFSAVSGVTGECLSSRGITAGQGRSPRARKESLGRGVSGSHFSFLLSDEDSTEEQMGRIRSWTCERLYVAS